MVMRWTRERLWITLKEMSKDVFYLGKGIARQRLLLLIFYEAAPFAINLPLTDNSAV